MGVGGEGGCAGDEEEALANSGGAGGSGGGGSAAPLRAGVGVSAAMAGRGEREKTPSEAGNRPVRLDGTGGGGSDSSNGCSEDGGAGAVKYGDSDSGGVATLFLEFKENGWFRTMVMCLSSSNSSAPHLIRKSTASVAPPLPPCSAAK